MELLRCRPLRLAMSLAFLPAILSGQTANLAPLSTVRGQIVIPELTAAEKQTLASQCQIFLRDLYVHRYHKPCYYWGQNDPAVDVQKVVDNLDKLSSTELEYRIARIFNKQRDRHLNFYFPSPHKQYTSFIPLTFARTARPGNYFEVRISAVNPDLFAQYAPGQRVPALGDEVITYNGQPVYLAAAGMFSWAQGANEFGGFSRALVNMTSRNHMSREVPKENEVRLLMRAYRPNGCGEFYAIKVPWLTQWTTAVRTLRAAPKAAPVKPRIDLAVDPEQEDFSKLLKENGLEAPSAYPNLPTLDPNLTYGLITNTHGTFGYIRLTTFSVDNVQLVIDEIRRLLVGDLASTDGLIFDVRNNGGGYIELADKLPQLFARTNAQVLGFRLLNNDLNHRIFNGTDVGSWYPDFQKVVNEAHGNGKVYTGTAQFTSDFDANLLGEGYYKPVALLMNANCYSATDMFTCSMQDNNGALIYGEDPRTGAGGANVITHQWFVDYTLPDVFHPLPGDLAMRVAWRQTLRFGAHQGRLIEDYGCQADVDASRTAGDLVTGGAGAAREDHPQPGPAQALLSRHRERPGRRFRTVPAPECRGVPDHDHEHAHGARLRERCPQGSDQCRCGRDARAGQLPLPAGPSGWPDVPHDLRGGRRPKPGVVEPEAADHPPRGEGGSRLRRAQARLRHRRRPGSAQCGEPGHGHGRDRLEAGQALPAGGAAIRPTPTAWIRMPSCSWT